MHVSRETNDKETCRLFAFWEEEILHSLREMQKNIEII